MQQLSHNIHFQFAVAACNENEGRVAVRLQLNIKARRAGVQYALLVALLGLLSLNAVRAADVYVSSAPDGSLRYATQALDPSYRLAYREEGDPVSAAGVAPKSLLASRRNQLLRAAIERAARRHGLPVALVEAIVHVESNSNPAAVSRAGALGAMQLMPATAAHYGLTQPGSWRDPERNIDAGARYLKTLLNRHGGNVALALASYNAGPGAVARHRSRIPPYRETMLYVPAVLARVAAANVP